ncbi:MAG: hypothetical protein COB53_08750 [Elusimicrobia bacterium]|nr:MAG: hypothetical protein COB53_08750 [Elusimicrobiota bacterium]
MKKFFLPMLVIGILAFASGRAAAKVGITVTPKIWFSVENFNALENALLSNTATNRQISVREQVNIPLGGAAIAFHPADAPIDFLFNFYSGETDGPFFVADTGNSAGGDPGDNGNIINGTYELKRIDVEFLIRYLPKDKPWNLFTGIRINNFEDSQTITTPGFTWNASNSKSLETETTILLWEFGAGFQAPIDEAGVHRFFGNTTIGFGSFKSEFDNATTGNENLIEGAAAAWDINTGYELFLGDNFSFSARYRMYARPTSPVDDGYNLTVIHGPDFGASLRF